MCDVPPPSHHTAHCAAPPLPPPCGTTAPQATDYSSVVLEAERGTGLLLGASVDRAGGEWVTAASLDVDTLLVRRWRWMSGRVGEWAVAESDGGGSVVSIQ